MGRRAAKDDGGANEGAGERYRVAVAAQKFIRTPTATILEALISQLETESEKCSLVDFCERLEALYALRIAPHRETLRTVFDLFCANAPPTARSVASGTVDRGGAKGGTSDDEESDNEDPADVWNKVEDEEDFFMDMLHLSFEKGNFQLLAQREYESATAESFEIAIDTELNVKQLDTAFIERMHERRANDKAFAISAGVTRSVLIYYRGQGQATSSGLFVMEKVDVILSELIDLAVIALRWLWWLLLHLLNPVAHARRVAWVVWWAVQTWNSKGKAAPESGTFEGRAEELEAEPERVKERFVYRNTLRKAIRDNWFSLFTRVTLLETTYREMVIVYRDAKKARAARAAGRVPQIEVKAFANVPMADFEVVLPAQRPVTRALDVIKLVGVVAAAAVYVYKSVTEELVAHPLREVEDVVAELFPVLAGAGTYASKAVVQWMTAHKKYNEAINDYLFEKAFASNLTVFTMLMDSIVHQEHKEALLGFFFVWQSAAQTLDDLDEEVERFLARLNEDIDFDAHDAITKLARDQMVRYSPPLNEKTQLFYLPINQCVHKIEQKVTQMTYQRNRPCPYCTALGECH